MSATDSPGEQAPAPSSPGARLFLEPGLLALLVVATALKLALLATTIGTNDAYACFRFGVFAADHSSLRETYAFFGGELNHPPLGLVLMVDAIGLWRRFGLEPFFWLRLPALAGDLIATFVTAELLASRTDARTARRLLGALVLSPLAFAELFHGNTDLLWAALALLAALELERGRAGRAGAFVALAVGVKLPALVAVAPLAVVAWRERKLGPFALGLALVLGATFLPAIAFGGEPFVRSVFGYRGTLTLQPWPPAWILLEIANGAYQVYRRIGGPLALLASAGAALAFRREGRAADGVLASIALALLLAPAFGAQYLAWPAAAIALLGGRMLLAYHASAALQACLLYATWGALRPPHFADSRSSFVDPSPVPAFATWTVLAIAAAAALWKPARKRVGAPP